ncbi:MAG: hypothetical protein K2X82_30120 [Gemmataceae bacterium]|nr:hypothetical protein [Gemmataceae bacterium]
MSLLDAGGGFGPPHTVTANARTWEFVFDVPLMVMHMESLAREWRRAKLDRRLEVFSRRDTPGTIDARMAELSYAEYLADLDSGTLAPGGGQYEAWKQTPDGRVAMVVAAARVRRPETTAEEIKALFGEQPDRVRVMLAELKNALSAFALERIPALERLDPAKAAEVSRLLATSSAGLPG